MMGLTTMPVERHHTRRLWLYGLGMIVPAGYLAWRYPLWPNAHHLTDLGKLSRYAFPPFAAWTASLVAFFVFYLLAIHESRRLPATRARLPVFACGTVLVCIMSAVYPVNAIDIFIYAVRSRLFTEYGENPIAVRPLTHPHDPWLPFASQQWADDVSPYGPLWNWIAAPATLVAGDRVEIAVVAYKVLAALCVLAGAWVVGEIARTHHPDLAATASLAYLWSPLVLYEGVANGHNDVVLAVPLLLALLCWRQRRDAWVIPALVASALIKYVTVLLLPLAVIALWRRQSNLREGVRTGAWSVVTSATITLFALAPYFDIAAIRRSIDRQSSIVMTSPAALAVDLLQPEYAFDEIVMWAKRAGMACVATAMLFAAIAILRNAQRFPRAGFEVMFVYLLVGSWTFRSWYVIWIVTLAAALPAGWPLWRATAWSLGAIAIYGLFIWGWEWWKVDFPTVLRPGIAILFGPPVLASLGEVAFLIRQRWRRSRGAVTVEPPAREPSAVSK
jgi:putative effector of murein hydrolase LrgA (UPF0299 family)